MENSPQSNSSSSTLEEKLKFYQGVRFGIDLLGALLTDHGTSTAISIARRKVAAEEKAAIEEHLLRF